MAERKYFSANTVEQAVLQAARHYQVRPEDLAYEQIEKRHGYIRNRKRVLIQVDPAAPRRVAPAVPAAKAPLPPREIEEDRRPEPVERAPEPQADEVAEPDTQPVTIVAPPPPLREASVREAVREDWRVLAGGGLWASTGADWDPPVEE